MGGTERVLLVRIRSVRAALSLGHVREVCRPLPLAPLSAAVACVAGVTTLRGVPTPVVDPGILLGLPEPATPARLVRLEVAGRPVALAVEDVLGIATIPRGEDGRLPPLLGRAGEAVLRSLSASDGDLLALLLEERLVPEEVYREISGAGEGG